jgi:signal transduction histidine kinase/ligand-binding sensor domain-containing protein
MMHFTNQFLRSWLAVVFPLLLMSAQGFPATLIEQEFALTVWETEDDLPNNDVHSLCSDHRGFLWVGTASGPIRFDGHKFLRPGKADESFFEASTVYAMVEDEPGEVVFVHDLDARNRLMISGPQGIREHPANASLAPQQRIDAVFRERQGVLWILSTDRHWIQWQESGVQIFPPATAISTSQPASMVVADGRVFLARGAGVEIYHQGELKPLAGLAPGLAVLAKAGTDGVWIADPKKLHRWLDGRLTTQEAPAPPDGTWPPRIMLESSDGGLWLSFWNAGLFRWNGDELHEAPILHRSIRCLLEDRGENLWVGTAGGGLHRIRRALFALWAPGVADTIGSVCEDGQGNRWLGNARGIWQLRDGGAVSAGSPPEWPAYANAICADKDGALWIGGSTRIFRKRPGSGELPVAMPPGEINHAYALFCARDGAMWAGCETGPLLRYGTDGALQTFGPEQGYDGTFAQVFGEDADGKLWVGTRRGGLFRLVDGRFQAVKTPLEESGTGILTITPGADGGLWLGTRGTGFLRLKNGVFRSVGKSNGLPDGLIAQTLADDEGNFWVGSSNSIFSVAVADLDACADDLKQSLRPVKFGRTDGINGFFATGQRQPCAFRGRDGRMWFVGRKGVVTLHPSHSKGASDLPDTFIEAVVADHATVGPGQSVSSANRRLEFRFTSPTFVAPDDLRFRYRLAGFEDAWSESAGQRLAVYPRLAPGKYVFEVTASSRARRWNPEPATFNFTVKPVWWEWWWLRLLVVTISALTAAWIVRAWSNRRLRRNMERLKQEQKVERERARIARDLHDGIGSGLTKLGWLAGDLKAESRESTALHEQSNELCAGIRELARELDAAVWAVSPKHDTLTSLLAYLCEFAAEHFNRTPIRCRVSTPDSLPSGPVAPNVRNHLFMATREALNNALKHSRAAEVHLNISYQNDILEIEVADTGSGFDPARVKRVTGHGLQNIKDRMREIQGRAEITSTSQGTRVRLILPLARQAMTA